MITINQANLILNYYLLIHLVKLNCWRFRSILDGSEFVECRLLPYGSDNKWYPVGFRLLCSDERAEVNSSGNCIILLPQNASIHPFITRFEILNLLLHFLLILISANEVISVLLKGWCSLSTIFALAACPTDMR